MIKNSLQKFFIRFLVKNLFNTIDKNDVLRIEGRDVIVRGRKLDRDRVEKIKEDAQHFNNSVIWKILQNEVKHTANIRMFEKSQTSDDILAGKLLLYSLEVIRTKIKDISRM